MDENVSGAKCVITQKKIDNLYKIVQLYKTPALVSKMLGVDSRTFKKWIENGEEVLNKHAEFASELTDCYLDAWIKTQEIIDIRREDLEVEFLESTKSKEITPKNAGRFEEFVKKFHDETLEGIVNQEEIKMIDEYKFHEHESKNETLKKYVKVTRVYTRACLARSGVYIGNIDKHAGTGKNVGLSKWMLETTEDSFKPVPQKMDVQHSGSVSLLDLSIQYEKQKDN